MTESQIACFEAVARHRSFSKAASHMMISQPAISHQISKLEQQLDMLLFDRTGREMQLTEAGELLLTFLVRARRDFQNVLNEARAQQDVFSGRVMIGCVEGWDMSAFLPELLAPFREKYPHVDLELVGRNLGDIESALQAGDIQVAITSRHSLKRPSQLRTAPLLTVSSILLFSVNHPVARKENAVLEDFRDNVFYVASSESTALLQTQVIQICAQAGFVPRIVICPSLASAIFSVQCNQGVLFATELILEKQNDRLFRHLPLDAVSREIVLAWRPEVTTLPANRVGGSPVNLFLNETIYQKPTPPSAEA